MSTILPILVEWRRIWRDNDNTLGCCGQKDVAAAAAASTKNAPLTDWLTDRNWRDCLANVRYKWPQYFPKEDAAREATCIPNASWKLGREFAINCVFRTAEVSVTDFGGDLDLYTAIMDEDNQGMVQSVQFIPLICGCFSWRHVPL